MYKIVSFYTFRVTMSIWFQSGCRFRGPLKLVRMYVRDRVSEKTLKEIGGGREIETVI